MNWWTVRQLAEHYSLSRDSIYRAIERGELVAHRLGGSLRVSDSDRAIWEDRGAQASRPERPRNPNLIALRRKHLHY